VIALVATVIGVGVPTLTIALAVLGIPSILTNTFVGIRQVDRATIDAARGIGMSEFEILRKVELPLAVEGIMTGIRGSTVNIVATATIAPLIGVVTVGDYILGESIYGADGVLAGAIVVAILALIFEFALAGLQRRLTSKGLHLQAQQ
jgi:osmoprotectant transport system permease protein